MKNILQIIDYAAPYKGNFIASLEFLNKELYPINTVFLMPENASGIFWVKDFMQNGSKVYFIDNSFFQKKINLLNILRLLNICRHEKIKIIHTHFFYHNFSLFILKIIYPVKIVSHLHNHYIIGGRARSIKKIVFSLTSDIFIGVSHSVSEDIKSQFNRKKVLSIPNGIDFTRLNFNKTESNGTGSSLKILMFGWPYHRKGIDIAIQAIICLKNKGEKVKLSIVLAGGEEIIKNEIFKEFGQLPAFIEFLPPKEDVAAYFNNNDILLSASREEGFNYTLVEGAFCNCLIISSDINGIPKDIPSIELFASENSDMLVVAIENLIRLNDKEKSSIKEKQREYVTRNFSLQLWAKSIIKCYQSFNLYT